MRKVGVISGTPSGVDAPKEDRLSGNPAVLLGLWTRAMGFVISRILCPRRLASVTDLTASGRSPREVGTEPALGGSCTGVVRALVTVDHSRYAISDEVRS